MRKTLLLKNWIFLVGILISASFACRALQTPAVPTPTSIPAPTINELTFEDPETEVRFKTLNECIMDITGETWRTTSYKLIGNFYESRWCTGTGARDDCQITDNSMHKRDQRQVGLNTLFYPDQPTLVFGLGLQSLWTPESTGWGAVFYFSEKGKTIIGNGWNVSFHYYDDAYDPPTKSISLGSSLSYQIVQTTLRHNANLPLREDLAIYLNSPESMRDRGIKQYRLFLADIEEKLNNHEITTCDWGEYKGDGIPPVCNSRPMNAEEEEAEVKKAQIFFEEQIQLLQEDYQELHAAWMASFPFDDCWR